VVTVAADSQIQEALSEPSESWNGSREESHAIVSPVGVHIGETPSVLAQGVETKGETLILLLAHGISCGSVSLVASSQDVHDVNEGSTRSFAEEGGVETGPNPSERK
jgi:hypothetical protein